MRWEINLVALFVVAVLVFQFVVPAAVSAQSSPVTMNQVIKPLDCTVSVTTDGFHKHVQLMPEVCMRSAKARQLLNETLASFDHL